MDKIIKLHDKSFSPFISKEKIYNKSTEAHIKNFKNINRTDCKAKKINFW